MLALYVMPPPYPLRPQSLPPIMAIVGGFLPLQVGMISLPSFKSWHNNVHPNF
jgi:hypothetical protein